MRHPRRKIGLALLASWVLCSGALAQEAAVPEEPSAPEEAEEAAEAEEPAPPPVLRRPGFERPGEKRQAEGTGPIRSRARQSGAPVPRPTYGAIAVPDRWRIVEAIGVNERFYDPYHQNTLKGDRPILGTQDWFMRLDLVSDTLFEPRRIPLPAGIAVAQRPDLDIFGEGENQIFNQNWIVSLSFINGDTAFKPPDWEIRFAAAANINQVWADEIGVLEQDPSKGNERFDWAVGLLEAFVDKHLWNKSDRYDFDSLRVGVQPFITDFRGFLYEDNNLGVRWFGNAFNNRLQYNFAWFRRIEKDTNSGLPRDLDLRDDDVFFANLYYQDFPVLGFTSQAIVAYNRNDETDVHTDTNGFRQRPAPFGTAQPTSYDVAYIGLNGDGHVDRFNLTYSFYYAVGNQKDNPIAQQDTLISAFFAAAEGSVDFDWYRLKLFGLFQSGDEDPRDDHASAFDAIFENPNFAGASTSFWVRQNIPFIFGGGTSLTGRNSILNSLRTSKEEGQSNFVNPGLGLVGVGADFDVLPELRILANFSWLNFIATEPLDQLRQQPGIDPEIGWDLSMGVIYRPLFIENVVMNLSGAVLIPGRGFKDLYPDRDVYYSAVLNFILSY